MDAALVLVVDDEKELVDTLVYNLEKEGFRTRQALTGMEALEKASVEPVPDLVILDLMLPDVSGFEVCRRLKQSDATRQVPVLMLTAKGEEINRIVGLEIGADDYVAKPFSVRELLLRIQAILRRSKTSQAVATENTLSFGSLRIDEEAYKAWVEDEEVRLTALEFRLLVVLLRRKGRVQSRQVLLSDVWGIDADVTTRTVDTHVKRLREKIRCAGKYIETVRGVGYRFLSRIESGD